MNRNKKIGKIISTLEIFINEKKIEIQKDENWNINIRPLEKIYKKRWLKWFLYRKKQDPEISRKVVKVVPNRPWINGQTWVEFSLARRVLNDWDKTLKFKLTEIYYKTRDLKESTMNETDTKKPKACIYCATILQVTRIGFTDNIDKTIEENIFSFNYHWIIFTENYKEVEEAYALRFEFTLRFDGCFPEMCELSKTIKTFVVVYCALMQFHFTEASEKDLATYTNSSKDLRKKNFFLRILKRIKK